jgi:hypothetical protein
MSDHCQIPCAPLVLKEIELQLISCPSQEQEAGAAASLMLHSREQSDSASSLRRPTSPQSSPVLDKKGPADQEGSCVASIPEESPTLISSRTDAGEDGEHNRLSSHALAGPASAGPRPQSRPVRIPSQCLGSEGRLSRSLKLQRSRDHLGVRASFGAAVRRSFEGLGGAEEGLGAEAAVLEARSQSASAELGGVVIGVIPDSEIPDDGESSSQVCSPACVPTQKLCRTPVEPGSQSLF